MSQRETWRDEAAELMRLVASHLETMAKALDEDDDILGALAGMGLANHLPMLPAHIRHALMEQLEDEAARACRADAAYMEWRYPEPDEGVQVGGCDWRHA